MNKNFIKIIPDKRIKRKIINKIKFSSKLSKIFLPPLKQYKLDGKDIQPTLFSYDKFAININYVPNQQEINKILDNFLFKFDLYMPTNKKHYIKNNIYVDNVYTANIFNNINNINNYNYIINIEKENCLKVLEPGFIESCLTLLNTNIDYIYIGGKSKGKDISKKDYNQLVDLSENEAIATLEKCCEDNTKIECSIFSTKLIKDRLEKIKLVKPSKELLNKYLKNLSHKVINYSNEFIIEKKRKSNLYFETSYDDFLKELLKYDTITFDIFDTLVTRTILLPDDLFHIIEKESKILMPESFLSIRKKAEQNATSKLKKDVSLDEIYESMKKLNILKNKDIEKLKELEIAYELKHIIPREDMLKVYNELLRNHKNIDIISDMYLPESIIVKILEKCKITNYRKLYISNELNMRKDTGMMWDKYFKSNKEKTIHIGDNYNSDYIQVLKRKRKAIKILSSHEYLIGTDICQEDNIDIRNELAILYNQMLFNSPFVTKKEIENNLKLYGEKLLAPIFYTFFDWFSNISKIKKILFVSREGYYLQTIYEKYCELFNKKKIDNVYFLTSRRATTIASCKTGKDLLELAKLKYDGTLDMFFKNRYGVTIPNLEKTIIALPDDYDKVEKIIINNQKIILENAAKEREEYLSYIKTVCKELKDHIYAIVDLGYSGTVQYYLSKLLGIKIDGYYFTITNKKTPSKIGCTIKGCFNENSRGIIDENNKIYATALYLESFLSAPHGQLIRFKNNKPVFKDGTFNQNRKKYLDLIYEGVVRGLEIYRNQKIKPFSIESMNKHYGLIREFLNRCEGDLEKVLYLDDDFCRDGNEIIELNDVYK